MRGHYGYRGTELREHFEGNIVSILRGDQEVGVSSKDTKEKQGQLEYRRLRDDSKSLLLHPF